MAGRLAEGKWPRTAPAGGFPWAGEQASLGGVGAMLSRPRPVGVLLGGWAGPRQHGTRYNNCGGPAAGLLLRLLLLGGREPLGDDLRAGGGVQGRQDLERLGEYALGVRARD